jgi:type II secretory pathway pseudopilin PulG
VKPESSLLPSSSGSSAALVIPLRRVAAPGRVVARSAQRGVALFVGLILLLVITVLAVAAMTMATSDLRMAANRQFRENAFQAATRGVELAMLTPNLPTTGQSVTVDATPVTGSTTDTYAYTVSFDPETGVTNVPAGGYSLGTGSGFSAFHFEAEATGSSARGSEVVQEQGFYIIGPAPR